MKRRVSPFHSFLNSIIDFVFIIIKYKNMRFLLAALMLFSTTFLLAQNIDVKGKIVDTNQQILEGASTRYSVGEWNHIQCKRHV